MLKIKALWLTQEKNIHVSTQQYNICTKWLNNQFITVIITATLFRHDNSQYHVYR